MKVIDIDHITKDYGNGKGVFDVTFSVNQGEVMGFLGPNGSGKTTTIRQLMGFIRPDSGSVQILGMDCFQEADTIKKSLGYLPGEIAFMEDMTGIELIHFIAKLKKIQDFSRIEELLAFLDLSAEGILKKMSKGMKQKIGIICALMQNPDILILDEPTSGLDPLMQNKFIELILEEKKKGTTILMSSHIFEEVERTCDRAAMIKNGRIITVENVDALRGKKQKSFVIQFSQPKDAIAFASSWNLSADQIQGNIVQILVTDQIDRFIKSLSLYSIEDITIRVQTLEELFMHFYEEKALSPMNL